MDLCEFKANLIYCIEFQDSQGNKEITYVRKQNKTKKTNKSRKTMKINKIENKQERKFNDPQIWFFGKINKLIKNKQTNKQTSNKLLAR